MSKMRRILWTVLRDKQGLEPVECATFALLYAVAIAAFVVALAS